MAKTFNAADIDGVSNNDINTPIRASLLEAWATAAKDPGAKHVPWLREGSPAGINKDFELDGVFPNI